jgi:hypothetical protein
MERPKILPLPGNSIREVNFYDGPALAQSPGVEWPGPADLGIEQGTNGSPTALDPMPFVIIDTNGGR